MNKHDSWFRLSFKVCVIRVCYQTLVLLIFHFLFSVQVPFLYVNVNDATLQATHHAFVTLNCNTKSSKQRHHTIIYEWRKDGVKLADESSSPLKITYSNATDTNNEYRCVPNSSNRDVQCTAVYQCSASLVAVAGLPEIENQGNSTVTVKLSK